MRNAADETTEIDFLERISHFFGKKLENPINFEYDFVESSLRHINNQTQHGWIERKNEEVAMPKPVIHRFSN